MARSAQRRVRSAVRPAPRRAVRLEVEQLETRALFAAGLETALPIEPTGVLAADVRPAGETDLFRVTLGETGRLTARVHGETLDTRLSLLGPDGQLLVQSDGQTPLQRDDLLVQHLLAGTYFLRVEGLGGEVGGYTL